jgi:gliding motility-associated-like protein
MMVVLAGSLLSVEANAQPYTSRLGRFQVAEQKGCAPFTVNLTILAGGCTGAQPCNMDFLGNGTQVQNQFTFTYTTPGTYTLKVFSQLNPNQDDIVITVDQNIQANFELYSCSGRQVQLRVTDTNYDSYFIDFDGNGTTDAAVPAGPNPTASFLYPSTGTFNVAVRGRDINSADNCANRVQPFTAINTLVPPAITTLTAQDATTLRVDFSGAPNVLFRSEIATNSTNFQQYQSLYAVSSLTIPNLTVDDRFYCIRLNSFDPCTSTNTPSNIVCSHNFDLSIQSGVNRLTWTTGNTGQTGVSIARDNLPYVTLPGAPVAFNDNEPNIVCNTDYCYRLTTNYPGGAQSISLTKCGRSFTITTPPAITNTSAVVNGSDAQLEWQVPPSVNVAQYRVLRETAGAGFSTLATATVTNYIDNGYNSNAGICYRIDYTDGCGNASNPGITTCPIRLSAAVSPANEVSLSWTPFAGWQNGVNRYVVYKLTPGGGVIQVVPVGTALTWTDPTTDNTNQQAIYQVEAIAQEPGVTNSASNRVEIIKNLQLIRPTAFTPNGDGLNDTFSISGQFIRDLQLQVFDRWGGLVYSSQQQEPWDGTLNGKLLPEGAYVWSVRIIDFIGRELNYTGTVALLNK